MSASIATTGPGAPALALLVVAKAPEPGPAPLVVASSMLGRNASGF